MNAVYEVIRSMVPVKREAVWGMMVGAFGALTHNLFGEWNSALEALLVLMVMDYISGMLAAYINPRLALNSQKGFRGIARKVYMLIIIALAHKIDMALGVSGVCVIATWFYIGNEGLSIVENAAKAGVPVPDKIQESLEQLARQKKAREKGEGK